jgi:hypothetical protein
MEVTKEALEKYTQAARKAYCSMPKFNDDRWQSATRAVLALVPEPSASDLERIQSSYSSGSQSGAQDQTTAAAPQTDEDAELVEELCEAQFKKGAATNIRSVLSRLAPAKEPTAAPQTDTDAELVEMCSKLYVETDRGLCEDLHWRAIIAAVRAHDGKRFSKEQLERIDWAIRDNYIAHGMNANRQFREQVLARLTRLVPDKERTSLHDACQVLENARQQAGKEHL